MRPDVLCCREITRWRQSLEFQKKRHMGDFQAASHVISLCWVPWCSSPSYLDYLDGCHCLHEGSGHVRAESVRELTSVVNGWRECNWVCLGVSKHGDTDLIILRHKRLPSLTNPTNPLKDGFCRGFWGFVCFMASWGRWMTTTSMRARRSCEVTISRKNQGDFHNESDIKWLCNISHSTLCYWKWPFIVD